MNIRQIATFLLTAGVLATAPICASALSTYTLNGNYIITGDLYVDSLLGHVGQCLEVGTGPSGADLIVATGSPCGGGGGGGVSSVTAGPSGNITAAPTTGAVIVDEIEDPTFTGPVTGQYFVSPFTGGINFSGDGHFPLGWFNSTGQQMDMNSSGGLSVAGIINTSWGMYNLGSSTPVMAFDGTSLGIGGLNDSALSPGNCVQAAANGQLTTVAGACSTGSGTVTAVTGTSPIVSSGGTTPAISCTTCLTTSSAVVTSVTSANSLLTASPTTGAVVLTPNETPVFTGQVSGASYKAGNLTSGDCLSSSAGVVVSTSTACASGGGSVTSVTGTTNQINVTNSTTTPVVSLVAAPIVSGLFTANQFTAVETSGIALNTNTEFPLSWVSSTAQSLDMNALGTISVSGVANTHWGIFNLSTSTGQLALDAAGDLGIRGAMQSASAVVAGFPVPQTLHGNQSITAVAASCTAGTPITFAHTFSAAPDIVGSTSPVVGDTFSASAITTTGFTPNLCSVGSSAAATVYWTAVN